MCIVYIYTKLTKNTVIIIICLIFSTLWKIGNQNKLRFMGSTSNSSESFEKSETAKMQATNPDFNK